MSVGLERAHSRRDTALFLTCVVLSVIMLVKPDLGQRVTDTIRSTVLRPFLWMQVRAERSRTSRGTFDRLRAERDSAVQAAQFLPALRAENERLRRLLGLAGRLRTPYAAAEVLHQTSPTDGRTLLLSAGKNAGVSEFDPVVSAEGLVGVIRSVDQSQSVAITWSHPDFRASAYALPGLVFGVVRPAQQLTGSDELLQLGGVAIRDTVPAGTMVVTSGLGGVYPSGIPVGRVIGRAETDESAWERIYTVRPAAQPMEAEQVLILRGPADSTLGSAFQPEGGP
jgi:rod shape-determining protein MreC